MTPAPDNATQPVTPSIRFRGWIVLNLLSIVLYLLPLSFPGERFLLLLGLGVFWAGVIAAFSPYRGLRLIAVAAALLCFFPVRTGTLRLVMLCGLLVLWGAALVVFRRQRPVLVGLAAVTGVVAGFLLLPGRTPDPGALQAEYVRSLQGFQGTFYIWGGENAIGIDCSGLIRCGRIDADLRTGLRTLNPGLVRQAARIWWQDCSAKELGEGYRNRTVLLGTPPALNHIDGIPLQPGDLAVTQSGVHILAYLGDHRWIEADPLAGSVITEQVPAAKNPLFALPMKILRWRMEEQP